MTYCVGLLLEPVSYTHLDVYKRQRVFTAEYLQLMKILQSKKERGLFLTL